MIDVVKIALSVSRSMLEDFDVNRIQDIEGARQAIVRLLNLVEELAAENRKLREEVQRLRDEINRLKGEQGKPKIKPSKKAGLSGKANYSSERERCQPKARRRAGKVDKVKIDREEVLTVDPDQLPADAKPKGYEDVTVQDIKIETDHVLFHKEKYYSPSENKIYLAELPVGYEGQFGPGLKALTPVLYYGLNTSEPKIVEFYEHVGILISKGEVSKLLIKDQDDFHAEKEAVYKAGLQSSAWQQSDTTETRVNGVNHNCHTVGNPLYTVYVTTEKKDRLAVLEAFTNGRALNFVLNAEAHACLEQVSLSAQIRAELSQWPQEQVLTQAEFTHLLDERLPKIGPQQRRHILEAAALAAYHAQQEVPIIDLLVCDDAPQYKQLTDKLALCWIHDGRHYKKLTPVVPAHQQAVDEFLDSYWDFYHELLVYKQQPTPAEVTRLSQRFDELFSTVSGYDALDERIAKTKAKQDSLLMVLKHPEIPLHNNDSELAARRRARKRDVSFGPRTQDGKRAWDTFMSLAATTKKLGVSFYQYIRDRVSGANKIPPLADLIAQQAEQRQLDASWDAA
jgi:cell division protein FtsB